ncbi:uncharacterized protein [Montipora capricornis]|uniref:uncharacterized protein isoform X1 n=1 Tax=Montipora foliosa TaxID=591990 RepID=UPI0035F15F1D
MSKTCQITQDKTENSRYVLCKRIMAFGNILPQRREAVVRGDGNSFYTVIALWRDEVKQGMLIGVDGAGNGGRGMLQLGFFGTLSTRVVVPTTTVLEMCWK